MGTTESVNRITVGGHLGFDKIVSGSGCIHSRRRMLRDPSGPPETFKNQLVHSLVTNGHGPGTYVSKSMMKDEKFPLKSTAMEWKY
jgi:hypothetical protein